MRATKNILLFLLLSRAIFFSQTLTCPSPYVYMDGSTNIMAYDPGQALSSTNPFSTGIPTFGSGLTLMPNISGGTLTPTFYTTSGGNYYYWSGSSWVNTNHSTGNSSAVNIAGCAGKIYNIVGSTGQVYVYDGASTGTLLTTISGFSGGGPYDLVTDCNCNFYALNTTTPNQALTLYDATGTAQCTYTLNGMPNTSAGGGFAIIGNMIYVKNNVSSPGGFYIGTIGSTGVTFTAVSNFTNSPGDFASCPVCNPSTNLNGTSISGSAIGCNSPTANLVVSTTATPVTYNWSGPGIIGSNTNSFVTVNIAGVYSCTVNAGGCPPSQVTLTTSVINTSVNVLAAISPTGNICIQGNSPTQLTVAHSASTDIVVWTGSSISPVLYTDTLIAAQPGAYTVTVSDILSGCSGSSSVNIIQTPTISLALSDNTLCLYPFNNSPSSITLTPTGATNYTLLTTSNYSTNSPNGNPIPLYPVTVNGNLSPLASATLIGSTNGCVDTTYTSFTILPNPTVTISAPSASICPGKSHVFSVSGATNYAWGGALGLNTLAGPNVIATPASNAIYTVMGNTDLCNSVTKSVSVTILPIPSVFLNPSSSTICLGSSINFTASGSANSFSWTPANGLNSMFGSTVSATPTNSQLYTVTGVLNTCTNTANAMVYVVQPPNISLSLSSLTVCAQNFNNSPTSITLTPSGASTYTLLSNSSINLLSPNGPSMQAVTNGSPLLAPDVITTTLIGQSGVCLVSITKQFTIIPNPVLTINPANANICPNQSMNFVANGASTYTWLPMSNYTLTSANSIQAKPLFSSFYSVFGNTAGCNSDVKNAVLVVLPVPVVTVSPVTTTVCFGNTVTLNAGGEGQTYYWYPSNSLFSGIGSHVVANPLSTQEYTVIASLNTCTNQATTSVSVIPIPTISALASQATVCSGVMTNITAIGASSYFWYPSNYLNSNSGNVVLSTPNSSITYTIKGYNGACSGSTTIRITTVKRPDMELFAESNQVCLGSTFTMSAAGAQTYTWLPPDALLSSSTESQVIIAPLSSTNYTIIGATGLGSVSCQQQLSYFVTVVPLIKPVVSENSSICEGEKTLLIAGGGNTYTWSPSAGLNVSNAARVVANPTTTTIYSVEVSDNTFCGASTTVMVGVNAKPKVFAGRDTSFNLNDAIFINASGTGTVSWISGEDISCSDCPYTQIFPTRSGCYIARAVNEFDCFVTDDICIDLSEEFSVYIPNSITPNKDGLNDVFLIYGEHVFDVSMEIYNRWGLLVFNSNDVKIGWDGSYNGEECAADTYTYKIRYTGSNRKKYIKTGHVFIIK
jgi:gliding motility-associated-like protein